MQQTMSAVAGRAGTDRWIMTGGFGLGVLAGLFDEFSVNEGRSGADYGDEARCFGSA
jgi:hypothetical protein